VNSHTPSVLAVLFCTHKRGAGLALFEVGADGVQESAARAAHGLVELSASAPLSAALPLTGANQSWYKSPDGKNIFAVCSGLTAENLAELYRSVLVLKACEDASVGVLGVVTGPGSFTGLRLGCAFANGLGMGLTRECWSVNGAAPAELSSRLQSAAVQCQPEFLGENSSDPDDPYAVPVSFADLFLHLDNWARGEAQRTAVLEPVYGRDPTPVIKLRQQQGETLS
jgi:hypothetical protein